MAGDRQVPAARGDQDLVGEHQVPLLGLLDLDRRTRVAVEPLGEDAGELRQHVLHDQDRRQRRGQ